MVANLLGLLLVLFQLVLVARAVVDWIDVLGRGRGGAALDTARRITHSVTEPVLAPVRRRVRPVTFGGAGLDLSFLLVFVAVLIARIAIVPLIPF
ncbi:YggT family protein [Pseudonocardia phyllosphaerae]|uniref:YggT family protein n=1 Tax=Pseudonocardia phyllosphaerae TaxID=3390502 RepID=UPI00397B2909